MTVPMIIALVIVVGMIVAIMTDKFSFGAPPVVAAILMVVCGILPIETAFKGFIDTNVIMVAGFMAVMAALQKTSLMAKIKAAMGKVATKGGFLAYAALIIIVMLGTSLLGGGNTGWYVMVITVASTIPYTEKLPNSKLVMPMGFATGRALIPVSVAFFLGLSSSLLDGNAAQADVTLPRFAIMSAFMSVFYLAWALIAYKLLPSHDVQAGQEIAEKKVEADNAPTLAKWQEIVVYAAAAVSIIGMMFASSLGEIAYVLPLLCTAILVLCKVFTFKEARNQVFSPLIIMMAAVIGVAEGLASTGFTTMVGEAVARAMGGSVNMFLLIFVFSLLVSACATLTGASIGSLFVFAPIAIAACTSMGVNPAGVACAMTAAAWGGGFLPIDGMPAMVLGMGKYKLTDFLKYSIPMYLIQILGLSLGAYLIFPH